MKEIPKFYNCLDETLKEIISLLFQGFKKRKSNFHNTVLCTVTSDLKPEARTVVLRNFSMDDFTIKIHSDKRSNKILDISKNKNTCLVYYDPSKKIQLRVRGTAVFDDDLKPSWEKLKNWSRRCYLTDLSPGSDSNSATSGFSEKFSNTAPSLNESEKGFKNFMVIKILIEEIEWLFLASQGHRRALFKVKRIKSKINLESKWLIP